MPLVSAASAQDVVELPYEPIIAGDALAQARAAEVRHDPAEALARYLRVLAVTPDDVAALSGAGRSSLAIGDSGAALGFYARAQDIAPHDGQVAAGLGSAMVQVEKPRQALRFFREAVEQGVPLAQIAADRGLAYDLRGDWRRAQADYQTALRSHPDEEVTRRLALSQAIGGDRASALATLDPLLRLQDRTAWRTRAFVLALTGDADGAVLSAQAAMVRPQADALAPYLRRLAALRPADKAAAVNLGRFPEDKATPSVVAAAPPATPPVTTRIALVPPAPPAVADTPMLPMESSALASDAPLDRAAARRQALADRRARAQTATKLLADRHEKAEAAARAQAERHNPARVWVQVAGGANKRDLPRAWSGLKAKWGGALAGRSPWTMHYRFTNRLLIGPFKSSDAAMDFVNAQRDKGFATFMVRTDAGEEVARLGAE